MKVLWDKRKMGRIIYAFIVKKVSIGCLGFVRVNKAHRLNHRIVKLRTQDWSIFARTHID